jgi:hypothetical protein
LPHASLPVRVADAGSAKLIDEQLAGAEMGIGTATGSEASEARIGPL